PNGSVDFFDTTTNNDLGTVSLVNAKATLSTRSLPTGTQSIKMSYLGNGNFVASNTSVTVTIVASVFALDGSASGALTISGQAVLTTPGRARVVSTPARALPASGSAKVRAGAIQVVGKATVSGTATLTPAPQNGAAALSDPMAALAVPTDG